MTKKLSRARCKKRELRLRSNRSISERTSPSISIKTYLEQDILPIQVLVCNKTGGSIYFGIDGAGLSDTSDRACPLLSCPAVVDKAKKSQWRTAGWGVAFGLLGVVPSVINVSDTNRRISSDYESRILKGGTMADGGVNEGVAFFSLPPSTSSLDGLKFRLVFKNLKDDSATTIETDLHGVLEDRSK